nr:hypothetical protein [Mucilaginibacter sp. FT3.2]
MVINLHFFWIFILAIPISFFIGIAVINQINRFYLAKGAGESLSLNRNSKQSGKK